MDNNEVKKAVEKIFGQDKDRIRLLSRLLDDQRDKRDHLLALRVRMGDISSYLTSVTLGWVAENVRFVASMPIYDEGNINKQSEKIEYNENTYEYIFQRNPNWPRQIGITEYLARQRHRKFPPLLVVGYQSWISNKKDDKWQKKRAMRDSLTVYPLDNKGAYYDMNTEGTEFYALDGQHRLMAILGLKDLLTNGRLYKRDADGKPSNKNPLDLEEVINDIIRQEEGNPSEEEVRARLQSLMDEEIGIEIIPAVVSNETWIEAIRRLRASFVDVNRNAKLTAKGENYVLDDKNGYYIVARYLMLHHSLLKNKTKLKGNTLGDKELKDYTTLETVVEISKKYLSQQNGFSHWESANERPYEDELQKGIDKLKEYFDRISELPTHKALIQAQAVPPGEMRDVNGSYANVLFRPIAQIALADAVGKLIREENNKEVSYKEIIDSLTDQEKKGMLKLTSKKSPWFGVLSNLTNKSMRKQGVGRKVLCQDLFHYLLGGKLDQEARDDLQTRFVEERKISDDKGINIEGEEVDISKILLPDPWRYPSH